MRAPAIAGGIALALMLAACQEVPSGPASGAPDAPPPAENGSQAAVVSQTEIPAGDIQFNLCTGEPVLFSGKVVTVFRLGSDGSGGFHLVNHLSSKGVTGTGLVSGRTYRISPNGFHVTRNVEPPFPVNFTSVFNGQMITTDGSENFSIRIRQHLTVTATGEVTVDRFVVEMECRG